MQNAELKNPHLIAHRSQRITRRIYGFDDRVNTAKDMTESHVGLPLFGYPRAYRSRAYLLPAQSQSSPCRR